MDSKEIYMEICRCKTAVQQINKALDILDGKFSECLPNYVYDILVIERIRLCKLALSLNPKGINADLDDLRLKILKVKN